MENTSGQGSATAVPAEIDRWNWGAFLLNWIWGIGNNTFIALLMFVPLVNVVMAFVLGAKGSAWAWRNKRWDSVAVQDGPTEVGSLGGRRVRRVHLRLRRIVRLGNWPIDRITFEQDVSGHHLELGQ